MSKTIQIVNGPSREELFDGLRLMSRNFLIPFCLKENENEKYVAVIMQMIEAEDGSGESWNLRFHINNDFLQEEFFIRKPEKKEPGVIAKNIDFTFFKNLCEENYLVGENRKNLTTVKAYYSTKTRHGVITVEE